LCHFSMTRIREPIGHDVNNNPSETPDKPTRLASALSLTAVGNGPSNFVVQH
jgi:hypothetical protein